MNSVNCMLRCAAFFIISLVFLAFPSSSLAYLSASEAKLSMYTPGSRIDKKVEAAISSVLKINKKKGKLPAKSEIAPLLEFMMTADGNGRGVHPEKRTEGMGIYWRGILDKPFTESLRYFYNPNIPSEILYPSSLRQGYWLPDSDILSLKTPIWEQVEDFSEEPIVLNGVEFEEITPDDFSGCYYNYKQNRTVILMRYKDVPVLLSVTWQDGRSETGMKGSFLGDYDNWDFVFTKETGGTATGLGWMSTYMYSSCAITLVFPQSSGETCYSMFKWLKAGWSGLNVVKREHITSGADRNFRGMLEVISGKNPVGYKELESISKKYDTMERPAMLKEAAPYALKLAELSKDDEILNRDEFQAILKGGIYAEQMSDAELRSFLKVLALKHKLGKPVLGM